jgi:hypothetical protein
MRRESIPSRMHLVQLLLPLYSNSGIPFNKEIFNEVRRELVDRFGGITAYTRAPVDGRWQLSDQVVRDDLVIYEVMVERMEEDWWRDYRVRLENRFEQNSLVIRAHRVSLL